MRTPSIARPQAPAAITTVSAVHSPSVAVTVSVGVAVAQVPDETPQAVLARADRALYRAKSAGRDQVVLADPIAKLQAA